jgi:hypothetical protein
MALYKEAVDLQKQLRLKEELPHLFSYKPYQWAVDYWNSTNRMKFICSGNQAGKALVPTTPIPTPDGFRLMGDIQVGDYVFGRDGKKTKVIAIPFEGDDLCYEITFDDGDSIVAGQSHDWICMGPEERFRKDYKAAWARSKNFGETWENPNYQKWQVRSTKEIYEHCYDGKLKDCAKNRYVIPMCEPVEYDEKDLPIDPYIVGLIIGDGSLSSPGKTICVNLDDKKIISLLVNEGATVRTRDERHAQTLGLGFIAQDIKELELDVRSGEKRIPPIYMQGSIQQRMSLLAGLMDTDGTVGIRGNHCTYSTISKRLADDFKELANSLGCMAQITLRPAGYKNKDGEYIQCSDCYQIALFSEFNPFRLSERKKDRWKKPGRYKHQRVIYSIRPIGNKSSKCITVENEDGSFLAGREYIVTHNSSFQIRHMIDLATDPTKWAKFFPKREPKVFWYIYPDGNKVVEEWQQKWSEFMPRGSMKGHPQYGWTEIRDGKGSVKVQFNTGVFLIFKTWRQDFQSSTVDAVFVDEEIPFELYDEISQRIMVTEGIFSMAFTATLGQKEWYDVIELQGKPNEKFPHAFKRQVSLEYDCKYYADGSPSPFDDNEIARRKALCSSPREIDKRIHGRFVSDDGLAFPSFSRYRNVREATPTPQSWLFYGGVDIGMGGTDNHPAAITITAVNPTFTQGKVYKFWKGNRFTPTMTSDILNKYIEMTKGLNMTANFYDWHSKEFLLRSQAAGLAFRPADKARDFGFDLMNTLFKNQMYFIEEGPQTDELIFELEYLKTNTHKSHAEDDAIDSCRYSLSSIQWNFDAILLTHDDGKKKEDDSWKITTRHENPAKDAPEDDLNWERDVDEMNELLEGF